MGVFKDFDRKNFILLATIHRKIAIILNANN